ncbi:MAG: hypothetical protein JNM39_11000 [Bdellovibrionaceae bacterium]|nr:hypothetical protein [Pseudobdellovibrionaceae bacterium]
MRIEVSKWIVIVGLVTVNAVESVSAEVQTCSTLKKQEVLEAASAGRPTVELNCHLTLQKSDFITKQVRISGNLVNGLVFDCHGATLRANSFSDPQLRLLVRSLKGVGSNGLDVWRRPENILIKNCNIEGSTRVMGVASNGEGKNLTESSRQPGHTGRTQSYAPRGIIFNKNKFIGQGATPIYFAPGVNYSAVLNSHIGGYSKSVAVYFDAESAKNTLDNNVIDTKTIEKRAGGSARELVAIDGSAYNKIANNYFSSLNHGGIYLYRNCGEGGNIRHQTSRYNEIVNNTFYYNKYRGELPAIWVASRNGNRSYCDLDIGYDFGSSSSDLDHAINNKIHLNQFFKLHPNYMIRVNAFPNEVESNEVVTSRIIRTY